MVDKLADKTASIDELNTYENLENSDNISLNEDMDIQLSNDNTTSDDDIITSNTNNDNVQTNCLALTVRKDYNLVIVKNIFTASGRISWKVLIASAIINFLNLIF